MGKDGLLNSLAQMEMEFRRSGQTERAEIVYEARQTISTFEVERALPSPTFLGSFYGYDLHNSPASFENEHYTMMFPPDRTVIIHPFDSEKTENLSTKSTVNSLLDAIRLKDSYKNPENVVERMIQEINWLMFNKIHSTDVSIILYKGRVAFVFKDQGTAALFKVFFN